MFPSTIKQLILSSSSPARKLLLERLQIPFTSFKPDVDETALPDELPIELVTRLAKAKAEVGARHFSNALVIGCDQVLTLDNEIFGKPKNYADAVSQLTKASGKQVISYTGLCLLNSFNKHLQIAVVRFDVIYRELNEDLIRRYLERDQPLHCAGSIKAESLGVALFERMQGDDPTALIGLPLIRLVRMLENEGVEII